MSTEFYRLKHPFTSARITIAGSHTHLSLWVNHAKAGEITLRNDEVAGVLLVLRRETPSVHEVGIGNGKVRLDMMDDLELRTTLISEYGEITCLQKLKEHR